MEDSEHGSESESDQDVIAVDFKHKGKRSNKAKPEEKGIMGLKFMQRAEQNEKERLKEQAKMLIDQIKEEEDLAKSSGDDTKAFVAAGSKFSKKVLPVPTVDEAQLKEAAQKLLGREVTIAEAPKNKTKKGPIEVTFDLKEDLKSFKTEKKKIVTLTNEDQTLKNLFIT